MNTHWKAMMVRFIAIVCILALTISVGSIGLATTFPYDVVSAEDVNIRQYPRSNSMLLGKIKAGEIVTLTSSNGNFYGVRVKGQNGYAMKIYIDGTTPTPDLPIPANITAEIILAVSSFPYDSEVIYQVKLRKTDSENGEVIKLLYAGTPVTVLSYTENGYAKVKAGGTTGYVNKDYINLANISLEEAGTEKYEALQKGYTGEKVLMLQSALCELGYLDADQVDGKFGAKTETALKTFQKRNGLEQDGIASSSLQTLLYEGTPKNVKGYRKTVTSSGSAVGTAIQAGSTGSAVKIVQARLMTLGYYEGGITGTCDSDTQAAILLYQGKNGFTADGVLTAEQQALLFSEYVVANGPEPTPSPTPAPRFSTTLRLGSTGEEVVNLQNRLTELGYYTDSISGIFDKATQAAVKAVQEKHSLDADGIVGPVTHTVIYGSNAISAEQSAPLPTPVEITMENVIVLRAGATGEAVLNVQQRLQDLSYYISRLDGNYLTEDIAAVKAFQKENGLTVDGTAGYQTQSILFSEVAKPNPDAALTIETVLRLGSKGSDVLQLQEKLKTLNYYMGAIDGIYETNTKEAVKAFQKANGLTVDGTVGTKTLEVLNSPTAKANIGETLKLGMSGDAVKLMQSRLIELSYLIGKADGIFGQKTSLALTAFQKNNGLKADGIAGTETLTLLQSTSAKAAKIDEKTETEEKTAQSTQAPVVKSIQASQVKYAYWYAELRAKSKLLPNITLYDFTTGISWSLNMFSFGAHADCEPLTAEDTEKMNKAFGGKTTWTPKAVWAVFSDGTVYMASTHNTPHGVQHNRLNGFEGHLCIHFPRTESQVASIGDYATSHQRAIDNAWEATQKKAAQ